MRTVQHASKVINICHDRNELTEKLAEHFVALASAQIRQQGRFTCALSGGSTPRDLYSLLATPKYSNRIAWAKVYLFFGDERCVPHDDSQSNFYMAKEALLSKVPLPRSNIFATVDQDKSPEQAAANYQQSISDFFSLTSGQLPSFDLILLGLGPEGHTASMFPGSAALAEEKKLVMAVFVEKLDAWRLTLTLNCINQAKDICFIIAGQEKADIVAEILESATNQRLPAQLIAPRQGKLEWFVDESACTKLSQSFLQAAVKVS